MNTYTTTFSISGFNRHREGAWRNDDLASQGAYGTKEEYVGRIIFSIGKFNNTKYKITGVKMQVTRKSDVGAWGSPITLYLYAGYITPDNLRKSPDSYDKQRLNTRTLQKVAAGATTFNFSSSDIDKFNTYCMKNTSYSLMLFSHEGSSTANHYTTNYTSINAVSMTITYTERAAQGVPQNATLGEENVISFTPLGEGFQYKATWELGNYSYTSENYNTSTDTATTQTLGYTIPIEWGSEFPTAFSKAGSVTLKTYDSNGGELGDFTYSITYNCPTTVIPDTVLECSPSSSASYYSAKDTIIYIQSLSKINIILSALPQYGAEITDLNLRIYSSSILIDNYSLKLTETEEKIELKDYLFDRSGNIIIEGEAIDSRGLSKVEKITYEIISPPGFSSSPILERANSDGTADAVGKNLKLIGALKNSKDGIKITGVSSEDGSIILKERDSDEEDFYISKEEILSTDQAYQLEIHILSNNYYTDSNITNKLDYTLPELISISTAKFLLHFKQGGNAIGIGSAAINDNAITCGWPIIFHSGALSIFEGGTGSSDGQGAFINIVSQGGTITGELITEGALKIKSDLLINNDKYNPYLSFSPTITTEQILGKIYILGNNSSEEILNNSQFAFRQYTYEKDTTNIDNNNYETFLLPATSADFVGQKDYTIMTTKEYPQVSDFYVMPGETMTFSGLWAIGHLSSSRERLYFPIVIKKDLSKITTVTINSATGQVRQNNSYLIGTSNSSADMMGANQWAALQENSNIVQLTFSYSSELSGTNNDVCQVTFGTLKLSFA